jgi:hypothetical protein
MAGKDYGPRGCCGPSAYGVLFFIIGGLTVLGWWVA